MKTIYVCRHCGSPRVFADAWASLNSDTVRTFDHTHCDDCEGPCFTKQVKVSDEFCVESDTYGNPEGLL